MNFLHIKETCLYVNDLTETQNFYEGKLGLEVIFKAEERHIFFRAGSSVLLCFNAAVSQNNTELPAHGASGNIHFALEVNIVDYMETKNEIVSKGITIEHEHEWRKGLLSFYFRDPDNHLVEIAQKGIWE